METSKDGIWVFDLDGRLLHANQACADLMNVPLEGFLERSTYDFLDEVGRDQFAAHFAELRAGRFNEAEVEVQWVRPDGERRWVLVSETPLYDDTGLMGVLHRMTDFTDRRHVVQQLSASEERLAEAQRMARIGSFNWDFASGEVTGSAELYHLMERPDSLPMTSTDFTSMISEDQRDQFAKSLDEAMSADKDIRLIVRAKGRRSWMWVRIQGEFVRNEDGSAVALAGTVQDVTSTVEAEQALKNQIAQNTLMEAVASAANEASTMADVLERACSLVLEHDGWVRAQGYACHDGVATPLLFEQAGHAADASTSTALADDLAIAQRCMLTREITWHESGLTLACPVIHAGEVRAVCVITSGVPIHRRQLVERMAQQGAVQMGRVAEREATARELAAARDVAEEASRQKSSFLALISHEIRTPLNGVIGLNEILMRGDLDAEQRCLASGIELSGRTLLSLINNVLDFSKIEAGHLMLESVDFDVRAVVDSAITPLFSTGRSQGLLMQISFDDEVPEVVNGDPTRLLQVLSNLVSNAVKFTEEGTVDVQVSATPSDGGCMLRAEVRDTGAGTDVDPQTLFAPFKQAHTSTMRVFGGTGLGLSISREIVEALGGEIGLESQGGGGMLAWFTAALSAPAGGVVLGATRPAAVSSATAPKGDRHRRILVVEDNQVNQMVAVGLLEALGYAVDTADDGLAALTVFDPHRHDLILMDLQMPRMDGLAATRELRNRFTDRPRVPVIAMTAAAVPGERERCLDAGMDGFLTKPVDLDVMARTIASWLDLAHSSPPREDVDVEHAERVVDGVDLGRLDMLRDMDPGSSAYLERVVDRFIGSLDGQLAELRAAVLSGDTEALRFTAHRLAGSCGNLGLADARETLTTLEVMAESGSTEGGATLLHTLELGLKSGRSHLIAYRATHCAPSTVPL